MDFNKHFHLEGRHAFLSASKHHWVRYSEEKLADTFVNMKAQQRGSELHQLAHDLIRLGVKLPANRKTLNAFVNDAIGYRMESEQILYYSDNSFGTADAISFRRNKLRIHDLKTGVSKASVEQLEVYAALFCLEYMVKPFDIEIEMRIYQNDDQAIFEGDPDTITHIMDRIVTFDKIIDKIKNEV